MQSILHNFLVPARFRPGKEAGDLIIHLNVIYTCTWQSPFIFLPVKPRHAQLSSCCLSIVSKLLGMFRCTIHAKTTRCGLDSWCVTLYHLTEHFLKVFHAVNWFLKGETHLPLVCGQEV